MSYKPKHLGHVNIYVRNVERSHKWYSDLLGLHTYAFYPGRARSCRPTSTSRTRLH
jgi:catechol 2,3-dioxygenase